MSPNIRKRSAKAAADAVVHHALNYLAGCNEAQTNFRLLLRHVRSSSTLLCQACGRENGASCQQIVGGLIQIARHRQGWVRPIHKWAAPQASLFVQFRSLVKHLFARFPVPKFMAAVWLGGDSESACRRQRLFLHLGLGRSVRQYDTPIKLTKGMARHFMLAPDDASVEKALRWGQVRGLGGDRRLARTLLATCLASPTADEPFWESVIRFLVANAPLADDDVREIVKFIHEQRFQPADMVVGAGAGSEPLQRQFTIRGRSLMSLRRQMVHWQEEVRRRRIELARPMPSWPRTTIGPFRFTEHGLLWTIDELVNSVQLRVEGGIMRHCVATYTPDCSRRYTSIWSMKIHQDQGDRSKRVLTIEVIPATRTIWQANARKNRAPDQASWSILNRWAEQEGLTIGKWVRTE